MGGKFWLGLAGATIAGGILVLILFLLFGWAWYTFGLLGAFLVLSAILLLFGWAHDRRERQRHEGLAA